MSGEGADYKCPTCQGRLIPTSGGSDAYDCKRCGESVKEVIAEHQEALNLLADSDLPCDWIAERLLSMDGEKA